VHGRWGGGAPSLRTQGFELVNAFAYIYVALFVVPAVIGIYSDFVVLKNCNEIVAYFL
jgi:hypothetical protein